MALKTQDQQNVTYDNMNSARGGNMAGIAIGILIAIILVAIVSFSLAKNGTSETTNNLQHTTEVTRTLPNTDTAAKVGR